MKTTIDLPGDLLMEIKFRALRDGRKFKDAMADVVRKGLGLSSIDFLEEKPSPIFISPVTGLPVIRGDLDAPGSKMTTAEVYAMIHQTQEDEDLAQAGLSPRR